MTNILNPKYPKYLLPQVVHRQEVRLRVQGQEQDERAQLRRQVRDARDLGEGDQDPRQRRLRARQVREEPPAPGHGPEDQNHDVPQQNLKCLISSDLK